MPLNTSKNIKYNFVYIKSFAFKFMFSHSRYEPFNFKQ